MGFDPQRLLSRTPGRGAAEPAASIVESRKLRGAPRRPGAWGRGDAAIWAILWGGRAFMDARRTQEASPSGHPLGYFSLGGSSLFVLFCFCCFICSPVFSICWHFEVIRCQTSHPSIQVSPQTTLGKMQIRYPCVRWQLAC